jgi:hypothetical protein
MDLDVWKSELSAKNVNMESVFIFGFNMDVRWMYLNPIVNIIRIQPKNPTLFVSAKNKVPIETI